MEERRAAVAGMFYPGDPRELSRMVDELLDLAPAPSAQPKALIVPHAGFVYSGPVAASAYAQLAEQRDGIRRVVLIGPSHRVPFRGLALSSARRFDTPMGPVSIDSAACGELLGFPQVGVLDEAHALEHSLEVQLPFLLAVLNDFELVPLVVGDSPAEAVGEVLEHCWDDPGTLVVVSSDLSHYLDYETANRVDRETTRLIEEHHQAIRPEQACGCRAINGLMSIAARRELPVTTLDLRNSGDTAGDRSRVVGYGAYALA